MHIGLHGARRKLDVGVMNGERFAVMAGTGFDAIVMRDVDAAAKEAAGPARLLPQRRQGDAGEGRAA